MADAGNLIESHTYQPGAYGSGRMKKGQVLRIIDLEGEQVADFIALKLNEPAEYLDCVYTNLVLGRWTWKKGDTLYTSEMRPMWTITEDTVQLHYTGGGFCSRALRSKYHVDDQPGCRETLHDALTANGIAPYYLQSVSCFNIFMNVLYQPDGTWKIDRPKSRAGDHIDLRAEMDLLWAVSICSEPPVLNPVNGDKPTPMRFDLYEAA
ncbi:MAG: DUF1989 domain-containing protein [Candidatus Binataceae bacterium]